MQPGDDPAFNLSKRVQNYDLLMTRRVRSILLVASRYDYFTFQEDGQLTQSLFNTYEELNLTAFPHITRVSSADEAFNRIENEQFDLVISLLRVGNTDIFAFVETIHKTAPGVPIVLLATTQAELQMMDPRVDELGRVNVHKRENWENNKQNVWVWPFIWQGDVRLFMAMIKTVEDRLNAQRDLEVEQGIRIILLIEDNVKFYSSYLPMLYTEVVRQTQALMDDSATQLQKLLRQRARPKVLLATTYEEGEALYEQYRHNLAGVVCDAAFPRNGKHDPTAGITLIRKIRSEDTQVPIVLQSQSLSNQEAARMAKVVFIHKGSNTLLQDLRDFMMDGLGFGPFRFKLPNGKVQREARDISSFCELVVQPDQVPDISIVMHSLNKDFERWFSTRGEFELAAIVASCPKDVEVPEMRRFLAERIQHYRNQVNANAILQYDVRNFDANVSHFYRIGTGSLGGKGRGLGFMHMALEQADLKYRFPSVTVRVPWTLAISTSVFDEFMEKSDLFDFALNEHHSTDSVITQTFLQTPLPAKVIQDITHFCRSVKDVPLAVRSSSLFEDTFRQPFAGIYKTYFLPNMNTSLEFRVKEVCEAVKLIYASTFWTEAKTYMKSTSFRTEEMKMAVLIQEIAGERKDHWIYPSFSGVARAHNFYPQNGARASDGIAMLGLGLGGTIVDGGACVRITPHNKNASPSYSGRFQERFMALDLTLPFREQKSLVMLPLEEAQKHGTLAPVGGICQADGVIHHMPWTSVRDSQVSSERPVGSMERLGGQDVHGLKREFSSFKQKQQQPTQAQKIDGTALKAGDKVVVTMDGVLTCEELNLRPLLDTLLKIGTEGFECPVEIEFCVNLSSEIDKPHEFVLLQTRPMSMWKSNIHHGFNTLPEPDISVVATRRALGNGAVLDVQDIVFVDPDNFDPTKANDLVPVISNLNRKFKDANAGYMLVCPGRIGTKQKDMGIPVQWSDINGTRCIVETDIQGIDVPPSEGTHFFQNLVSFGIAYFTVYRSDEGHVDISWMKQMLPPEIRSNGEAVRCIHFDQPLEIIIDGVTSCGVVMKPPNTFGETVSQQSAFSNLMNYQHSRL